MKQKIIISLTALSFIVISFSACCPTTEHLVPEEYIPVYFVNDTIIYKSNLENYDTIVCYKREIDWNSTEYCPKDKYENYRSSFDILNDTINYYSYYFDNNSVNILKFYHIEIGHQLYDSLSTLLINNFKVNNMEFDYVYYFANQSNTSSDSIIKNIYFNFKYGVLQYEYYSGEIYKIHKLIPDYYETENS